MTRNKFISKHLVLFICIPIIQLLIFGCINSASEHTHQPNVLIILTDDMGYGDISCYDDHAASTPHIDKLADEELLLGEVFQKEGYKTKLIGNWHLGHKEEYFPVKHGFDEYCGILYSNDMRPVQIIENMYIVEEWNPVLSYFQAPANCRYDK